MIQFSDLALRRGRNLLFEKATAQIHPGHKIGITGANGTGKSTLFAAVLGQLEPDAGLINLPSDWVIAHVAQHTPATKRTSLDYVLDGDVELRQLEQQMAEAENDGHRLAELFSQFESIGGYSAPSRAAQLLHGLGFCSSDESRAVEEFSGGWRMRLNLAQALMCRSDLLLLDEPTNHLDLDAVLWLEEWLRRYPGALLLISHDREFLDRVVQGILHIEQHAVRLYTGNYSDFERQRAERLAGQQAVFEKQQREVAHMRSFVDRFRAKATKAKQAQSRLKALERMELIAPAHIDSPFHFEFKQPQHLPDPLLRLRELNAGYGSNTILENVGQFIFPGDRIGLLGPNGAGKSTLIKILAGELDPQSGLRDPAKNLNVGYFAQHQLEQLHGEQTPMDHLFALAPDARESELRSYIGGFGFGEDKALSPVAPFSGGEKARLVLALLVYQRPNLLLLDEPTNHLDLEMREALVIALQEYQGALVVVSHDRHLLRTTTDTLLLVNGGKVQEFDGGLDDYPAWLAGRTTDSAVDARESSATGGDKKAARKVSAAQRKQLQPLRRKVERTEAQMEKLSTKKQKLETALSEPSIYEEQNKDQLQTLLADQAYVQRDLGAAEEAWMEASEALEEAQAEFA